MNFFDTYGFCSFFQDQMRTDNSGLMPGRVVNVQRNQCRLATPQGEKAAQVSGRFAFTAIDQDDYPQVGDWVLFRSSDDGSLSIIERVLERKSVLRRKGVGGVPTQTIATNIDAVLIIQSCNQDLNLRRLERYLAACGESHLQPVLVFNKSDLLAEKKLPFCLPDSWLYPRHLVSAETGLNLDELSAYLQTGKTTVLIGSSGVGKSTLINRLGIGAAQFTQDIREADAKGRHTTTTRELFFAKNGGMIIDTPGMREFGLADADVVGSGAFSDIDSYATRCRFRDCAHSNEPGCAVRLAIEEGQIDAKRLASLQKLRREEEYFQNRANPKTAANSKRKWKTIHKAMRQHPKKQR